MAQAGWIKIHRKITENWLYPNRRKFTNFEAWLHLLLSANYDESKIFENGQLIPISRGQTLTSELKLSFEWMWSRSCVRNFLKNLQKDGMILLKTTSKYTLITICNYESYQDERTTERHQKNNRKTSKGHQKDTSEEGKEDKESKEGKEVAFIPPTLEDVVRYFSENGYTEAAAQKAFRYYNEADWHDKNGDPVRNWKRKMNIVWFKPENEKPKRVFVP